MKKKRESLRVLYDWMGVLFLFCLIALALTDVWVRGEAPAMADTAPAAGTADARVIVVDAGHGGADGGAQTADKVPEAGLNLTVAKLVEKGLRDAGFTVVMTRTDESALGGNKKADMQARRDIMRQEDVAAVVSVHMNKWRDSAVHGPMAFYMKGSAEGEQLAGAVIEAVCGAVGHAKRPANPGDYFVLRESICPAVIIECGFLSNPEDARLLQDAAHQKKLADGIVKGITAYLEAAPPSPPPSAAPPVDEA